MPISQRYTATDYNSVADQLDRAAVEVRINNPPQPGSLDPADIVSITAGRLRTNANNPNNPSSIRMLNEGKSMVAKLAAERKRRQEQRQQKILDDIQQQFRVSNTRTKRRQ